MSEKLTIAISTFNERVGTLKEIKSQQGIYILLVHQNLTTQTFEDTIPVSVDNYIVIDRPGLSLSRNIALQGCKTKYLYVMDDDVDFDIDNIQRLVDWMEDNDVAVSTCQFQFEDGSYPKNYADKPFKHNVLSAAKVASIEMCVNVEKISARGICFDERFGLGTDLPSGEEYIFITDCIKAGLNVWFYPITTGVHPNITSGMDFYTSTGKTLAKREMFKRVFGRKAFLFILAFWLKKTPNVLKSGNFWSFTKTMLLAQK